MIPDMIEVYLAILAGVLSIIVLGLTAYVVNLWDDIAFGADPPSAVSFLLFCSIWSLLALAYVVAVARFLSRFYIKLVALGVLVVTVIFWFSGSIAAAAELGTPAGCSSWAPCGATQAAIAFGFFLWAIFTGMAVITGLDYKNNGNSSGGIHKQSPHNAPYPYA